MKPITILILFIITPIISFGQTNDSVRIANDTLTSRSNIDNYLNQLVTIKGEISNTKIPQIIGIDISYEGNNTKGKIGIARGILSKKVVLEKDIDPYSPNRGAGTFYRLKDPNSGYNAKAKILR